MKTKKRFISSYTKKSVEMRKFDIMLFWNQKGWRDIFICKSVHKLLYKSFFDEELRDCLEIKTKHGWNSVVIRRFTFAWIKEIFASLGSKIKKEINYFIGMFYFLKISFLEFISRIKKGYNPFNVKCGYEVIENQSVYVCRYKEFACSCPMEFGEKTIPRRTKRLFKKQFKIRLFETLYIKQNG